MAKPLSPHSAINEPDTALSSTTMTDKYTVDEDHANFNYPEVAPEMSQPPLQSYHSPSTTYTRLQQHPYAFPAQPDPPDSSRRANPWGLSPLAFGLLIAAITAVVVGGAVGGGVAGALSNKNSDSTSTTCPSSPGFAASTTASAAPAPTSLQNFAVPEPYYVDTLDYPPCTPSNSTVNSVWDTTFLLQCGIDFSSGLPDENTPSKTTADFVGLFAYSLVDCMYACANAKHFAESWGQDHDGGNMQPCRAFTWNSEMAKSNSSGFANCWLKNGTSQQAYQCETCISASLQS